MYADDGIILSNKPIEIKGRPDRGIIIHPEKSRYIKYDGKVLCECKFLGLTYNLLTGKIRASTRKGATLEVSLKVLQLIE